MVGAELNLCQLLFPERGSPVASDECDESKCSQSVRSTLKDAETSRREMTIHPRPISELSLLMLICQRSLTVPPQYRTCVLHIQLWKSEFETTKSFGGETRGKRAFGNRHVSSQAYIEYMRPRCDELARVKRFGCPEIPEISATFTEEEILERLVALNAERAAEEKRGLVRWLRPEYQNRAVTQPAQEQQDFVPAETRSLATSATPRRAAKLDWPKTLPEQVQGIRTELAPREPTAAEVLALEFKGARTKQIGEILETRQLMGNN